MNAEQAWQATLGQLQMEMPRASFDTWLRDTRFLSWETEVFTVGTRNEYARDWLENRLRSTVQRLLAGMMNQSVSVRFVVDNRLADETGEDEDESDSERFPKAKEEDSQSSSIVRARVSMSEYEQIVKPGRKITFPAYFIRHIPRIGSELAWLVIALRQITYLKHGKPIPGREIARWSGMSLRSFRRWSKRLGEIAVFADRRIEKIGGQQVAVYSVWADDACPLTPADARNLSHALTDLLEKHGTPEAAVEALIEMTSIEIRERILPEATAETDNSGECVTINELVQWLGWEPELGLRLEQRIMAAFGLMVLTWHFVLNLLPLLDHGPAWMVTILRNLCYDGREQRSSTLIAPLELGRRCGLKGKWMPATLGDWLRKPIVQSMAQDDNLGDRSLGAENPHRYRVSFFDTILNEATTSGKPSRASDTPVEGKWHQGRGQVAPASRASGTTIEGKWHQGRGQVAPPSRASDTPLNLFNPLKQPLLTPDNFLNQPDRLEIALTKTVSTKSGGRDFSASHWVLSEILRCCQVNKKKQAEILGQTTPENFLAHLLYAYSPRGKGIFDLVGFAISRAINPEETPEEVFQRLANLPAENLARLLEQQYAAGQVDSEVTPPDTPDWVEAELHKLSAENVRALAQRLGKVKVISSAEDTCSR
jgi:hypothetical protein